MRTISMLLVSMLLICSCGGDNGGKSGDGGNGGGGGNDLTVAITSPANGATLSGIVNVIATANESSNGVAYVEFQFDNGAFVGKVLSSPYQYSWDTTYIVNDQHIIVARATDKASKTELSDPVTVTTSNVTLVAPTNISWHSVVDNSCSIGNRDIVISWTDACPVENIWSVEVDEAFDGFSVAANSGDVTGGTPTTLTYTAKCDIWDRSYGEMYTIKICQSVNQKSLCANPAGGAFYVP